MSEDTENSLVITRPTETSLSIALHPLVLLTASDLITRHHVRQANGPVAGVLLGQQKGQETTAEHAFAANLIKNGNGNWIMSEEWTHSRIQQFKDVHKAPALEAVGWFGLAPESGPSPEHAVIQKQFETLFNENGIFLAIHPATMGSADTTNRKLPLTIYESVSEGEDSSMQVDGEDHRHLRFRQLPYTIETDETEMIAIDYVAKGAGSAAAVDGGTVSSTGSDVKPDVKGKGKADISAEDQSKSKTEQLMSLSTEEEDQIAGITTRLNSVKMLQTRLQILSKFIQSLPPSYISDQTTLLTPNSPDPSHLPHLRSIQALLTRLSLLTPSSPQNEQLQVPESLQDATRSQFNDVSLISMLSQLGQNVQGLSELGRKFSQVEQGKSARGKKMSGFGAGSFPGFDDGDGRGGGFSMRDNGNMLT